MHLPARGRTDFSERRLSCPVFSADFRFPGKNRAIRIQGIVEHYGVFLLRVFRVEQTRFNQRIERLSFIETLNRQTMPSRREQGGQVECPGVFPEHQAPDSAQETFFTSGSQFIQNDFR